FSKTKEKNCILCGVIKDSRSRRISKQFSVNCSDTVLCSYLLEAEEMTIEMDYENSGDSNNLHKQKNTLSKDVKFFYIKPSNDDLPLRIEYLASEEQMVDRLAFTVYSLCSISPSFAYPAVLIEADMRAALDQKEILAIQNSLFSIDRKPLRRNSRPFR
ncbi:DNA double-strand break repair nuclease NurA, partial [Candidatus Micrarchaeota archaeon]|nr:DNA double-strand break repair nuclease NurA [Candidatus Micrarchaeota archaeon]